KLSYHPQLTPEQAFTDAFQSGGYAAFLGAAAGAHRTPGHASVERGPVPAKANEPSGQVTHPNASLESGATGLGGGRANNAAEVLRSTRDQLQQEQNRAWQTGDSQTAESLGRRIDDLNRINQALNQKLYRAHGDLVLDPAQERN